MRTFLEILREVWKTWSDIDIFVDLEILYEDVCLLQQPIWPPPILVDDYGGRNEIRGIHEELEVTSLVSDLGRAYRYHRLPKSNWIRVIDIHPGLGLEEVICAITTEPFGFEYEALSWCWGDEGHTSSIRVSQDGIQFSMPVKQTIEVALQQLRHFDKHRYLWIDSICINQDDSCEKADQVQQMRDIYRLATNVCIWLGPETDDTKRGMDIIRLLGSSATELHSLMNEPGRIVDRRVLTTFLSMPWFSRRWVIQEVTFAARATLHWGSDQVDWPDVVTTIRSMSRYAILAEEMHRAIPSIDYSHQHLWRTFNNSGAALLTEITDEMAHGIGGIPTRSLEDLVVALAPFECSREHDVVYALLSLANDIAPLHDPMDIPEIPKKEVSGKAPDELDYRTPMKMKNTTSYDIDYEKPMTEVYKDFVEFAVKQSGGCVNIICRYYAATKAKGWRGHLGYHFVEDRQYRRLYSRSLVGTSSCRKRNYNAASDTRCFPNFLPFQDSYSLSLEGFLLDSIAEITRKHVADVVPRTWAIFCGWKDWSSSPPEHFWRTLVADRDIAGNRASWIHSKLCADGFRKAFQAGSEFILNTGYRAEPLIPGLDYSDDHNMHEYGWKNECNCRLKCRKLKYGQDVVPLCKYEEFEMEKYKSLVQATVLGRYLFKSSELLLFGLVPEHAKVNDLICILHGCSVPVILRKHCGEYGRVSYELIGECYVNDMMDGQAVHLGRPLVMFNLLNWML